MSIWVSSMLSGSEQKEKIYADKATSMEKIYTKAIDDQDVMLMMNAINISTNTGIIEGLKTNDRTKVLETLQSIKKRYKNNALFGNVKIHVHDRNIHSFVRLWNPEKFGDDLSGFRKSIVAVKETRSPVLALEVGVTGVELRGIVPIVSGNEYVGSVEFMQGADTIVTALKKKFNLNVIIALDNRYLETAKELHDAAKIGSNLTLATQEKIVDKEFLDELKQTTLDTNTKTFTTNHYYTKVVQLKDFSGNVVAYAFLGEPLGVLEEQVNESKKVLLRQVVINSIGGFLILILLFYVIRIAFSQVQDNVKTFN
ncbi:MAG: cache domain-containing protein [Sulfuricurvum sp.]|uniref:cache domain-containing protein n=1 Tax=Sulfuricurvum sp. TaxID=2025608 RepID=UPI0026345697|nr:cache domain-containing protein [Sulfuricurvum sp.]MDD2829066.1 cache domain-containing protein [Sulfuricurvum sp.]MDD4948814.1 cache domain-containing protein [Sulfuricurvum sp.]